MTWGSVVQWDCGCTGNVKPHRNKPCPRIKADSQSQPENNEAYMNPEGDMSRYTQWKDCGCDTGAHQYGSCNKVHPMLSDETDETYQRFLNEKKERDSRVSVEDVELEARKIVRNGVREAAYGEPGKDFKRTAMMWSGLLREKLRVDITPEDVASMMVILKLSRLAETPHHRDSVVDTIGYMICYDRLQ